MGDDSLDNSWADALQEEGKNMENEEAKDDWAAASQAADFEELSDSSSAPGSSQNLEFLLDIPLEVNVELGRTSLVINKLLQLTQGSVVELEKAAGETVEIYVNHKLLGKGEVIVVNDRFGVRITEIISQADRIKTIG